jgi:hypothetical protein
LSLIEFSKPFSEETAHKYRDLIYAVASGTAEIFADIALCPFEAARVRVQTNPKFARGLMVCITHQLIVDGPLVHAANQCDMVILYRIVYQKW